MALPRYARGMWPLLAAGSVAGLASNVAAVLPAVLLGSALDAALALERGSAGPGAVGGAAVALVAGTLAFEVTKMGKRWWLNRAWARMRARLRSHAYRGAVARTADGAEGVSGVGDVVSRVVGDVEVVAAGWGEVVFETWDTIVLSGSLLVVMVAYDPVLAAMALAPAPIAIATTWVGARIAASRTTDSRVAAAAVTRALRDQLVGMRLVRLAGASDAATANVGCASAAQTAAELGTARAQEAVSAAAGALLAVGTAFVLWFGALRVVTGVLSAGELLAFVQLHARFAGRAPRLARMVSTVRAGGAAYTRVQPLLTAAPLSAAVAHETQETGSTRQPAAVSLQGVAFQYPGAPSPALVDVTLEIPPGALVVVTGPPGSGKTTLCRLLAGVCVATAGRLLVDGVAATEGPSVPIGYVPQDPPLFAGSVADNLVLGMDGADPRRVVQAVGVAGLDRDLALLPAGLGTDVGERGVRVSGGQRQRIALARALSAARPPSGLLVLDDSFASVDVDTEARVVAALHDATGPGAGPEDRATVVVCSSRPAAFGRADLVVVLDRGRVVEVGSPAQLLAAGGAYARLARATKDEGALLRLLADHEGHPGGSGT